jgi:hypothetical protein
LVRETVFVENVRKLVTACGSQEAVGVTLGVTQAAVSNWIVTGTASAGALLNVAQAVADYEIRRDWFALWRLERVARTGAPAGVEIELWADTPRAGRLRRRLVDVQVDSGPVVTQAQARQFGHRLAARWIGWSTAATGDFLIAFRAHADGSIVREVAFVKGWVDVDGASGQPLVPSTRRRVERASRKKED